MELLYTLIQRACLSSNAIVFLITIPVECMIYN